MNNNKSTNLKNKEKNNRQQFFVSETTIFLIAVIFLLAVLFNVFVVEFEKYATGRALNRQKEISATLNERLERIKGELAEKDREASQLIDFHEDFVLLWKTYHNSIEFFSAGSIEKPESVGEIKVLTDKRLEAAKKYLADFKSLKMPQVLSNFYNKNIAFINSDIKFWESVSSYYDSKSLKEIDAEEIEELANESKKLYKEAVSLLKEIYNSHDLSYFLKEYE